MSKIPQYDRVRLDEFYAPFTPSYEWEGRIAVKIRVDFYWLDRLLLLFRPVAVVVHVDTQKHPGRVLAKTMAWTERWRWPWQHNEAYALAKEIHHATDGS